MLLPQSSAFAALKNRLNSVSAIGLLHTPTAMPSSARPSYVHLPPPSLFMTAGGGGGGSSTAPLPSPPLSSFNAAVHPRQRSIDKPLPLSTLGSLTSASAPSVAGLPGSNLGQSASTSSVPGRLGRTSRDTAAGGDAVKWPELLEKFRNTQEKARRRNERIMRGEAVGGADPALGGGPATRSLLELDVGGRTSRSSGGNEPVSAGGRSLGRPGSGLGRPLRTEGVQSGMKAPGAGGVGGGPPGAAGHVGGVASGGGGGLGDAKGHKSRHSLAGTMGKFASGIARGGGSRDREKKDKK